MSVREYSGNAKTTKLNGAISNTDTALVLVDGTGYPTGASGPFVLTVDATLAGEEKLLCSARSGNNVTVTTRGYDGTTASAHDNQATIQHTISAIDLREANAHVNATSAVHGRTGALVGTTDAQTLTNKTLTTPTIGSFTNAQHNHSNATNGGLATPAFVGVRVYRAAAYNVPNDALTAIPFDAESFDSATLHDNSTNPSRITVPSTGKYQLSAALRFLAGAAGTYRAMQIWKNGTAVTAYWAPGSNTVMSVAVADIVSCAAGDYLELAAYQNSGGPLGLDAFDTENFLSVVFLGA